MQGFAQDELREIRDAGETHELGAGERIEHEKILAIQAIMPRHDALQDRALRYKPTNTGDVPAKHTATTLPKSTTARAR